MSYVTIHDWTPGGVSQCFQMVVPKQLLTASKLIELRVRQDVAECNKHKYKRRSALIEITDAEDILNSQITKVNRQQIDSDALVAAAQKGFKLNSFVMLVGERQIVDLNEVIDVSSEPKITFIRLIPLIGG